MTYDVQSLLSVGSKTFLLKTNKWQDWQEERIERENRLEACYSNRHYQRACKLIRKNEEEKALKQLILALREDENSPYAYDMLAYLYVKHGNLRRALQVMEREISLWGEDVSADNYAHLAFIYRSLGYLELWQFYRRKALSLDPDNRFAQTHLSGYEQIKSEAEKYRSVRPMEEDAKEDATRCRKDYLKSHDAKDLIREAYCWYRAGEHQRSLNILNIAEILDPSYQDQAWVITRKAVAYDLMGNLEKAVEEYLKIIDYPWLEYNFEELPLALLFLYGEDAMYQPLSKFCQWTRTGKSILQLLDEQIDREQKAYDQLHGQIDPMWVYRLKRAGVRCRIGRIEEAIDDVRWILEHTNVYTLDLNPCFEIQPLKESGEYERLVREFD